MAPSYQDETLITAVGLANGKVSLCSLHPTVEALGEISECPYYLPIRMSINNLPFIIVVPRQSRLCLCLVWNETEKNLLAMGYERNRLDYCISVWDTENMKEISTIGLSESCHSMCFGGGDKQANLLFAGVSHKHMKCYDLRAGNNVISTTNTRSVYGLSFAPNGRNLASYIDNVVNLWDVRNMEKALTQIQMQRNVNSLSWCPSRGSVLTTLQRDSPYVHLLDLHWMNSGEGEPHSTKRDAAPFRSRMQGTNRSMTIKNVSWHPTDIERMLALSGSGGIVDFQVPQRIAASFDAKNGLWGTVQGNNIDLLYKETLAVAEKEDEEEDILLTMHRRALVDYGLVPDTHSKSDLKLDKQLSTVWRQLCHMKRDDWCGLKMKLGVTGGVGGSGFPNQTASVINLPWCDLSTGSIKVYRSEQRDAAIQMCGWAFNRDKEGTFVSYIEDLSAKGERTKAAFIATVHLRIRYAIEVLGNGAAVVSGLQ